MIRCAIFWARGKVACCERFFVNTLCFKAACTALSDFICFEFWSCSIEHIHGFDACCKQGRGAIEEAHEVRDNFSIFCPQWPTIALWRAVSHRGQKLERGKEGIYADTLACEAVQIDGLRGSDVSEVAAHENLNG
jgi:hypothetical protein